MNQIQAYSVRENAALQQTINTVCAECRYMITKRFTPDEAWIHALAEPACDHHCLLLSRSKEKVIGWCRLFPQEGPGHPRIFELGIGVVSAYRRKGIGTQLIKAAIQWAKHAQAEAILLQTDAENQPAQRLFLKMGFQPLRTVNGQIVMILYM